MLADDLTATGHQALGVTCDVSDEDQFAALVERTVATFGRLDMAYNNAGIQVPSSEMAESNRVGVGKWRVPST